MADDETRLMLDPEVVTRARAYAAARGESLDAIVNELLQTLRRPVGGAAPPPRDVGEPPAADTLGSPSPSREGDERGHAPVRGPGGTLPPIVARLWGIAGPSVGMSETAPDADREAYRAYLVRKYLRDDTTGTTANETDS